MFKWILRAGVAVIAARLAAKYVHPEAKAENTSPYKAKPKERSDFGKRGKRMPAARRKPPASAVSQSKH
jgi:hypothetical protein